MLTATQQDYLEIVHRLETDPKYGRVRVTDIAEQLGTRLPTVTRTVQKLTELGYLTHRARREVSLTSLGRKMAEEILHRHKDLVLFFTEVLGLDPEHAERDVCQMEHGLSGPAAQRLHEFLEYLEALPSAELAIVTRFRDEATSGKNDFKHLPSNKTEGWRT